MFSKLSVSRKCFIVLNSIFISLVTLSCIFPFTHILALSLSSKDAIVSGIVGFWPVGITLQNYQYVIKDFNFYRSFMISMQREFLGITVCFLMTLLSAYPFSLSKSKFHARQFYVWFYIVAMLFYAGMIPTYLIVASTGLIDSIWSLILPGAVPIFYVLLLQNFIKELPQSISDAAFIDGAGYFMLLFRILMPLCKPAIASIILFIAVDHWNAWFDGMLYINNNMKFPLQTYLRSVIVKININFITDVQSLSDMVASTGADTAKIFVSMVPILAVYPFIQKNFMTGIVLGSVKE